MLPQQGIFVYHTVVYIPHWTLPLALECTVSWLSVSSVKMCSFAAAAAITTTTAAAAAAAAAVSFCSTSQFFWSYSKCS